ncbi:MAG: outer membrane lipoprotein-sorting protein [Phycisphaerae bacterium]|nr:outer membrane lipoprotein-sorting protein [Phycisphaerae bacterium]
MWKRACWVFVTGAIFGFAGAAAADELESVEKKIVAAWEKHTSLTAKLTVVTKIAGKISVVEGKSEGTLEVARTGAQTLIRQEIAMKRVWKVTGKTHKRERKSTVIFDDRHTYELAESEGKKTATKDVADRQPPVTPPFMLALLHKDYILKLLPEETLAGRKVYVIEAKPKDPKKVSIPQVVQYIDQERGVVLKSVTYGKNGEPEQTTTFTDFKFGVKIDPERFVFKPPDGVEVIDLTEPKVKQKNQKKS